jgi:hypothetical protein
LYNRNIILKKFVGILLMIIFCILFFKKIFWLMICKIN